MKTRNSLIQHKKTFAASVLIFIGILIYCGYTKGSEALKLSENPVISGLLWLLVFLLLWRFLVAMVLVFKDRPTEENLEARRQIVDFHKENDLFTLKNASALQQRLQKLKTSMQKNQIHKKEGESK